MYWNTFIKTLKPWFTSNLKLQPLVTVTALCSTVNLCQCKTLHAYRSDALSSVLMLVLLICWSFLRTLVFPPQRCLEFLQTLLWSSLLLSFLLIIRTTFFYTLFALIDDNVIIGSSYSMLKFEIVMLFPVNIYIFFVRDNVLFKSNSPMFFQYAELQQLLSQMKSPHFE